ncbi:MAG: helix-turn-helix transcriptional regulator [Prevotellaceae bacterium]|jgi:transcriptional regulator with XRE-family HTH domain|nr:helix-turn-helix transcriptional regulator [Prevotellaceae bacterium]
MSISLKINRLIFEQKAKKKDLYTYLGISKQTLEDYLNEKTSMTVLTLEKVAAFFKVPVNYFLNNDRLPSNNITGGSQQVFGNNNHNSIDNRQYHSDSPDVLRAIIDGIDTRIKEKDAQIKEKDAQINKLLKIVEYNFLEKTE